MPKYWLSKPPEQCDVCYTPLADKFYDASINGSWGCICRRCFTSYGCKLGTGKGQEYTKQADGRWLKTGGLQAYRVSVVFAGGMIVELKTVQQDVLPVEHVAASLFVSSDVRCVIVSYDDTGVVLSKRQRKEV